MTIWKQGYDRSENGWPMVYTSSLDYGKIPKTNFGLGVRIGEPNAILKALMYRLHTEVEPLDPTQCGCYTAENTMPNSNHNSATGIDYNWRKHPYRVQGTWGANKSKVDRIVADFRNTIEWGGYWSGRSIDEMHFEMRFGPGHGPTIQLAKELWSDGLWGIFKPGAPPVLGPNVPPTPIPAEFLLEIGSVGPLVGKLQSRMNDVFPRYRATPLAVDNIFGPNTALAVMEFQSRASEFRLAVDGKVGPKTRAALAAFGVKL